MLLVCLVFCLAMVVVCTCYLVSLFVRVDLFVYLFYVWVYIVDCCLVVAACSVVGLFVVCLICLVVDCSSFDWNLFVVTCCIGFIS